MPLNVKDDNNEILISALKRFGVEAEVSGRNDICVNSKKVKVERGIRRYIFKNVTYTKFAIILSIIVDIWLSLSSRFREI